MKRSKQILLFAALLLDVAALAQTQNSLSKSKTWQLLDYERDSVYGASVNRAYEELLKGKKSHPVIVAVIDGGVDITQEDLQGHIWNNKKEIPSNGIDDDENGYIDDVHGWNFLGGKDGKMVYATSTESEREYARLLPQYGAMKDSSFAPNQKQYQYFLKVKTAHLLDSPIIRSYTVTAVYLHRLASADSFIRRAIQKQSVSYKDIESFQPKDSLANAVRSFLLDFYSPMDSVFKSTPLDSIVSRRMKFFGLLLPYEQVRDDPFEVRKEIVGDNPYDINDRNYGNNIVGDKFAFHGTHCSGIIAALRNNGVGMDGVADNVFIMSIRAAPPGDEMDKDDALAIRYAVDNGAKIISMSIGKDFSPQKQWVDDAVKYADKKGVLLVRAAGNDGRNIDSFPNYPNGNFLGSSEKARNMITVGAISKDSGFKVVAPSSNYGQKDVDLFAPGVDIYSTLPGNEYESYSGTSMAAPVVAGVAALVLEYYPDLPADQLKEILMKSVTSLKGKMVNKPGSKEKVDFGALCVSGGIVNAYKALQLAASMTSKKYKK